MENVAATQPTGLDALDIVLGGGLLKGALVVMLGVPGSGKTTLAGHLAFLAARAKHKTLILTALSEPSSKLIAHLSTFAFFDSASLVDQVQVLSLQQALPNGLKATGDEILVMVRQFHAQVLILDGFRGMRESEADLDQVAGRQFLYRLGTTLSALGVTTIVTSEADPRDPAFFPEMTTADVILGLHYAIQGARHVRGFEVIKARGAAPLPGVHAFAIDATGAHITPQLETLVAAAMPPAIPLRAGERATPVVALPDHPPTRERVTSGIVGLDAVLGGGLWRDQLTLLTGPVATGKTLVGLSYALAGVKAGEHVVYLSLGTTRAELAFLIESYTFGAAIVTAWQPGGMLTLLDTIAIGLTPDVIANALLAQIDATGARRLVIDGVEALVAALTVDGDVTRVAPYFTALRLALRARQVTTLFIQQGKADSIDVADTVLRVRHADDADDVQLTIGWQRYGAADRRWHRLDLTAPDGPRIVSDGEARARQQSE
jgi:circadian clock protein KaiC